MRFLRSVIALLAIIINCIPGCVEPYTPDEGETESGALAIYAHLTDAPEDQVIYISRSSNFLKPASSPEEYCFAYIERDDGWIAYFAETEPGYYVLEADSGYLSPGLEYRLNVETPSGDTYQSSFEKMHASMEIDSVYFNLETILGENDNVRSDGIRFFVDFNINKEAGTYLLWRLTETYEFHNPNYRGFVYGKDRRMRELLPEESWRTCWISSVLPDFYTLSATPFSNGLYRAKDLNFVSNQPQYLFHIYSLLVHQYTLSEGAYVYWRKLKDNSTALGGLFSRQPELINSNIRNTNNDSEKVI